MYVTDGLHLSGKGKIVFSDNLLRSVDSGTGCNYLNYIHRVGGWVGGWGLTEKQNTIGINKGRTKKSVKNIVYNAYKFVYKCVCLNARKIVNKRNELNIMVEYTDPHILGITESWATTDISDAE